jgi:hypothetical protein
MTDGFRVFPLPLQAIVVPKIRRQPFHSTSFQIKKIIRPFTCSAVNATNVFD